MTTLYFIFNPFFLITNHPFFAFCQALVSHARRRIKGGNEEKNFLGEKGIKEQKNRVILLNYRGRNFFATPKKYNVKKKKQAQLTRKT